MAIAADICNTAPGTLQLRYLHTLVKISAEKNSTILFPLPMEVMRGIQMFGNVMEQQLKEKGGLIDRSADLNALLDNVRIDEEEEHKHE